MGEIVSGQAYATALRHAFTGADVLREHNDAVHHAPVLVLFLSGNAFAPQAARICSRYIF